MQQENAILDSVATVEIQDHAELRGPVPLPPEMLAWISGGVTEVELPRAGW